MKRLGFLSQGTGFRLSRLLRVFVVLSLAVGFTPQAGKTDPGKTLVSSPSFQTSLVLALKYVVYQDPSHGRPVLEREEVEGIVEELNRLYIPCQISFRLEDFSAVHPEEKGLRFRPSTMRELRAIRGAFSEDRFLLVISTGAWNPQGGLGADGSNAWTTLPGTKPSGVVVEGPQSKGLGLVAHEIGHYLDLDHMSDDSNLMNAVIYDYSTQLSEAQCRIARRSAQEHWASALRNPAPQFQTAAVDRTP